MAETMAITASETIEVRRDIAVALIPPAATPAGRIALKR